MSLLSGFRASKARPRVSSYNDGIPDPTYPIPCPPKPNHVDETEPMELQMKFEEDGYWIWLDNKRLHHVESYKIESVPFEPYVELSIKLLVRYPVAKESKECTQNFKDERM